MLRLVHTSRHTPEPQRAPWAEASDRELLVGIRDGEEAALNELIGRKTKPLLQLCQRILGDPEEARDVVQVTFFRVWESRRKFDDRWSPNTWMYRIVMNVTIDWLRKKQIKGAGAEFDDAIQLREIDPAARTAPRAEPLPHRQMERAEIRERIDNAIAQLSPEHRAVILMKETEGMQYHEIAEALGCSIGTVMSRLFYARKKLQNLLRDVYENV